MLSESHLGGMLGPRGVASTSMKVGEAFNGFLELEAASEIPMNGSPLLQVVVRFSQVSVYGMPGVGNTDILAEVFGSQGVVHPQGFQPSAPQAMQPQPEPESLHGTGKSFDMSSQVFEMSGGQGDQGEAEMVGRRSDVEVGAARSAQDPVESVAAENPVQSEALSGSTLSGSQGVVHGPRASAFAFPHATNSVFYIDPQVYTFATRGTEFERLHDLSAKHLCEPFPSSPGRNFNVLGAGWDPEKKEYVKGALWASEAEKPLQPDIDDVADQFHKFATTGEGRSRHWCQDVWAIDAFLKATKDWPTKNGMAFRLVRGI